MKDPDLMNEYFSARLVAENMVAVITLVQGLNVFRHAVNLRYDQDYNEWYWLDNQEVDRVYISELNLDFIEQIEGIQVYGWVHSHTTESVDEDANGFNAS
jgi:hypothetical protein